MSKDNPSIMAIIMPPPVIGKARLTCSVECVGLRSFGFLKGVLLKGSGLRAFGF
jgi:hypothetical protein